MCRETHNGARTPKTAIQPVFHTIIFQLFQSFWLHSYYIQNQIARKRITFSLKYLSHAMVKNAMVSLKKGFSVCRQSENEDFLPIIYY